MKKNGIILSAALIILCLFSVSVHANEAKLIQAAKTGNTKILQDLLGQGLDINTQDKSGKTLLMLAASSGKYAAAELLIDKGADLNKYDKNGNTLLHYLAPGGKKEALALMKKAIDKGADIKSANLSKTRETPAAVAINKGNIAALELLMSAGFGHDRYLNNKPMIIYAYDAKQIKVVRFLAEKGANLEAETGTKESLLHLAVMKNDMATVQFLLDKGASPDRKGPQGRTPLFMAVEKENTKIADLLMKKGADSNTFDNSGRNIMHVLASGKNSGKSIAAFSGYGININKTDNTGKTPLMTAVSDKRWENVKPLVDAGASYKFTDMSGKSLLVMAMENRNTSLALYLIEKGIDVKQKNSTGRTALHTAASFKGKEWDKIITAIIQKGGSPGEGDNSGVTPAGVAIDSGNSSGFKIMLDNGLDINLKEKGTDPLVLYAYKKNEKVIFTELSKRGADIKLKDGNGDTILHLVSEKGDMAFYKTLAESNPDLNITNREGKTPLFLAIEKGKTQFAKMLLEQKDKLDLRHKDTKGMSVLHYLAMLKGGVPLLSMIEVNQQWTAENDASGRSPLALAVHANLVDNASFFLKSGADAKGLDWNGAVLVIIAYEKNKAMMNLLLTNGADPDAVNPDGKTLMFLSIEKNDISTLKLLVGQKVSINKKYPSGIFPLNHAIEKARGEIIQFLITSGAELNNRDDAGNTPLITAALKSDYKTASMLVTGGADVNIKTNEGKTVLFISYEKNRSDIFNLLLSNNAVSSEIHEGGNTLLHLSAQTIKVAFINSLVKNMAGIIALNMDGQTPLILAAEKGYPNSVRALITGAPDLNTKDKSGDTALFKCIKAKADAGYSCAEALVKAGALINDRNGSGNPLLHEAAANEKFSMVSLFLKNGADPNIVNQKNETLILVLSKTSYTGKKDQAKSTQAAKLIADLSANGSNLELADKYGRTPLDLACRQKNPVVIQALIKGGAKVDAPDAGGNTALKKSVLDYTGDYRTSDKEKKSLIELIDLLLKNGADINARDKYGRTVLTHILKEANQKNYLKVADIAPVLISKGASKNIKDNEGKSASDYASSSAVKEIRELVR
jgi:serine/threonine-protein phosphatase 6 regulatory ankyrin repeat subunit B